MDRNDTSEILKALSARLRHDYAPCTAELPRAIALSLGRLWDAEQGTVQSAAAAATGDPARHQQ